MQIYKLRGFVQMVCLLHRMRYFAITDEIMIENKNMKERRMRQVEKLDYIDGLKVLSCLMIFNFHFINAFYCGFYSLNPADYHTQFLEQVVGSTPLNLIMGGKFGVRIFMTISGFFVGYRFFLTGDETSLKSGVVKKYFRLVFPILAANLMIYILMKAGLFLNAKAAAKAGTTVFFGNYNQFEPSLLPAALEALWGCFATGANQYNGPLWFIYYEFFGTLLVAAILSLLGKSRARYFAYLVAAVLCIRNDFLPFILGAVVCDLTYRSPLWVEKLTKQKWLMWLMLFAGIFLGSFPPIGERLEGTIYAIFPAKIIFYYIIGASLVLFALLHLELPKKILAVRPLTWLNQYSYGFYLVHFFVLCTFSCGFYLALADRWNYHAIAILNYILSFVVVVMLSWLMNRFVEKPGMKLANRIAAKLIDG